MSEIIIRDAVAEDAAAIAVLEEATFPMPWSEESILHDIENNRLARVIVAECDGIFAGYTDVWNIAGEAQLNNIAVCESMRGRRVGLAIMEEIIRRLQAEAVTEPSHEVRTSNVRAIRLYRKLGFEAIGRREGYYIDNGEDALILRKDLVNA